MGQIVRRKRRGRPSNTDRARINYTAAPPSPVDRRSSRRRRNVRYNFDIDDYVDDDEFYDDEDEEVGRREKKLRLLLCEDDSRPNSRRVRHAPASSSSDDYDVDDDAKHSKKRKIDSGDGEDDEDNEFEEIIRRKLEEDDNEEEEEQQQQEALGGSDFVCGKASDHSKGVPLPDKKTLELILDKLQKKDTYGVYAEPVDPDELPDYHDVIKHPMDFATVRKKLAKGAYLTLKEFESDVFLICTNAMQYNAPDTIYYKQASSIQEQAKLRFQRLKANVDRSEIEQVNINTNPRITPPTLSFSPPKKQLKKPPVGQPMHDPIGSETLSGANFRIEEFPNAQTPIRQNSSEVLIAENSSLPPDNSLDKDQELVTGKGFVSKQLGVKPVHDENRRATYNTSVEPVTESDSVFSIFEGESKQFIPVGLQADHSYARSLARFAATLGSVAWKVASQTIEQALPAGVKYGRGWVGEYEPLPTSVLILPGDYTLKQSIFPPQKPCTTNNIILSSPKSTTLPNNVRKESPREPQPQPPIKDPKPQFFKLSASNSLDNLPPPIITRKPVHNVSDITPSPRQSTPRQSLPAFKHPNSQNDGFAPSKVNPTPVSINQQRQAGLSDPVQMMKMLAERSQSQSQSQSQENSYGFGYGSQTGLKRGEDSSNVGWMSLGGSGAHKQQQQQQMPVVVDSLYSRNQNQPQVTRFRGEVHFNGDHNNAYQQQLQQGFLQKADLSRFQVQQQQPSWRGVNVTPQQQQFRPRPQESSCPPDLNIGYQSSPVRQSTGMMVDSQQPDLALQL